jgi:hypothetical protein
LEKWGSFESQTASQRKSEKRLWDAKKTAKLGQVFSWANPMSASLRFDVSLIRGDDLQPVMAQLVSMTTKHLDDYDLAWQQCFQQAEAETELADWDWKKRVFVAKGEAEGYAIEYEDMTQGLMILRTSGRRSWVEPNRRIVYVSRLATAPWNRLDLQAPVRLKLVGSTLLRFAQSRSEALGYGGLVGVHALPEAAAFYRKLDMMDCGLDETFENLRYFEWYRPRPLPLDALDEMV